MQKHLTLSNHGHLAYAVIVNQRFHDGLPADLRAVVDGAVADATAYANAIAAAENRDALERIRASGRTQVHQPTAAETEAWKRALMPVHREVAARGRGTRWKRPGARPASWRRPEAEGRSAAIHLRDAAPAVGAFDVALAAVVRHLRNGHSGRVRSGAQSVGGVGVRAARVAAAARAGRDGAWRLAAFDPVHQQGDEVGLVGGRAARAVAMPGTGQQAKERPPSRPGPRASYQASVSASEIGSLTPGGRRGSWRAVAGTCPVRRRHEKPIAGARWRRRVFAQGLVVDVQAEREGRAVGERRRSRAGPEDGAHRAEESAPAAR